MSLAAAASYSVSIPEQAGMFAVRPWDLPTPVLLPDGSLIRTHYDGKALVVSRLAVGGIDAIWTHTLSAPQTVASPTKETYAAVASLSGCSPWMVAADAEFTRIFAGFGTGSTTVVLATKTGKVAVEKTTPNNGFSGVLKAELSDVFAAVSSNADQLDVQSYDGKGNAVAAVTAKVTPRQFDAIMPMWVLKGQADSALGTDGTAALAVGEGKGRLHLERWTAKGETQVGRTLIDGFTEEIALLQRPDGSTLTILRASKPGPGFATTDFVACVAPAGTTLDATCRPFGLEQIVGKSVGRFAEVSSEPTGEGGVILALQEIKDMIGQSNVTRIRGDILLVAVGPDGAVAWHTQVPFKTSSPISFAADNIVAPASLIREGAVVTLVTAAPFGGIFNQQWHLEAAPFDLASGAMSPARWKRDTDHVPVTRSLMCAGTHCSMIEARSDEAKIVVFPSI